MSMASCISGLSVRMRSTIKSMHKQFNAGNNRLDIKQIRTDNDYRAALKEAEALMTAEPDTLEGEKLDVLVTLIEAYEHKHFPLDLPDPIEAIKFEMEQKGLTVKDLEPMNGKSDRVYEVLSRKRSLTLKMIRKLHHELGIPAESLIKLAYSDQYPVGEAGECLDMTVMQ